MERGETASQAPSPWLLLATVMVGTMLIGLDRTVVNLGLPKMISDFSISVSTAGWIATSYIITNAIFVPVFGKLGDMYGNRFLYIWSFIGFIATSVLAGAAWNIESMIAFRALQGLVGAAIYPTSMSLIAKTFRNPAARAQALGIWSASFAVSAVLGPLIGGPLIDHFSWRMLFYMNLPVGIVGLLMSLAFLERDTPEDKGKFDFQGAILLAVALTALVVVLDRGREWGWVSGNSLIAYALIVVFGSVFYVWEKRVADPLVDMKFFKNPVFVSVLGVTFVTFAGMMGAMFLLPVFAQTFLGYNATQTGFIFVPMALTLLISSPIGAKLSQHFHVRWTVMVGTAISAFGIYLFSHLDPLTTMGDLVLPLVLLAFGLGLGMAPLTNAATSSVPHHEVGIASGILNLVRNLAGAIAIAVFGTILSSLTESRVLTLGANAHLQGSEAMAAGPLLVILKAQIGSYDDVFLIASAFMFLGAILAIFLKDVKDQEKDTETKPPVVAEGF